MAEWFLICPACLRIAKSKGEKTPLLYATIWYSSPEIDAFVRKHGTMHQGNVTQLQDVLVQHYEDTHHTVTRTTPQQVMTFLKNWKDMGVI